MNYTYEQDIFSTAHGDLIITFFGHGSLMFSHMRRYFYIDPFSEVANYNSLPKADLILLTHDHYDHLDQKAIQAIKVASTHMLLTEQCARKLDEGEVMSYGDKVDTMGTNIEAVPAYNIVHKRPNGEPFHPKGDGNGYILTLAGKRIYIAGDTEDIPEMADVKNIDIAFLPMNLPYTMTPEMAARAARMVMPKVLYPYHFGETDTSMLTHLLADVPQIDVRIRSMA